ncbi:UvrD-helicase domain-containing protein [Pseudomonas sp. GD03721]|nr:MULTISPECIES: UvrD-helicase domain-containing protein [unclassified Pseudomonas]MDH1444030.1 UvrD-helicase domain-containing protein [Pseudomonas sp. GD03722]WGG00757.1 UvrD-helicase domain-containing protein [Pseudomonas sp. GD03721]WGG04923.1 UvrD-helicase domain-containing protein [Pseudomonas sp. GD03919]
MKGQITFISAGAGSGKTHRLTELLHHELTSGSVRPAGIMATTFTKKAAAELRERVRGHLLKQGNFALANSMGQARIGTVNSVCGQLIARFAFEAGIATEQQVLEEAQSGILLGRAIDAVPDGPSMQRLLGLVRRLGLEDDWKAALQLLVNQIRSNDISLGQVPGFAQLNADDLLSHFPTPSRQDLSLDLLKAIRAALPTIEATAQSGSKKNTNDYLALLKGFARGLEGQAAPWSEWVKVAKAAPEASLRQVIEPIADLARQVDAHPSLHRDLRDYLDHMFDLATKALASYQALKQELGVLDFTDQEHQLLGLLDHPEVVAVLDDELDLLMVDEFQDTSPIQLALFLKLARFAKRVYWVGDIKQAIYGFRGSDTALMQAIITALPDLGGSKEVLPSSWRSRPELVKVVNALFTHAFADSLAREEIELRAERTEPMPGPGLANWVLAGKNAGQEASALASGVRQLIDSGYVVYDKHAQSLRPVRFGDIAILSRSHDGVDALAAALSAQGIPVATAQAGLLATPEATLALACLRRLNDPTDTLATAEIVSLADSLEPEVWLADRLRYLAQGGNVDLWCEQAVEGHPAHPLLEAIAALRPSMPVLAPQEALATLIATCSLAEKVARWTPDGARVRQRLANLEALVALAEHYESLCRSGQQAASVSGLILWLDEMAEQKQDMLAEPAVDAVRVLTHHAAKGLEWPVVILMDLAKDIKDRLWSIYVESGGLFDAHNPLADRYIRYWPWPFGPQKKVAIADKIADTPLAAGFRQAAVEEAKRLLYVSMTRARDLLVLARSSRRPSGEWLDSLGAPWLLPAEGCDAVELPSGERIPADRWMLEPLDEPGNGEPAAAESLHWFQGQGDSGLRLPLSFSPSSARLVPGTVLEKCCIGERIPVAAGADVRALGEAIHACIGMTFADPDTPLSETDVINILSGFSVSEYLSATAVLQQLKAFQGWLSSRWPDARPHAEIPLQSILPNGQALNGRIDLLLETSSGWVLFDHKSSQLAMDQWGKLANEYSAQLELYAQGLEMVSGKKVIEQWLLLPVAGGALSIERLG